MPDRRAVALETLLTGATGGAIGFGFGLLWDGWLGVGWIAPTAAGVAALNGLFSGARRTYAWRTPGGILAFVLDSSWAIVSTTLGVLVNAYNTVRPGTGFGPKYSTRQNRHVFASGFAIKRGFANTLGNVISNACLGRGGDLADHHTLIVHHEGLHVWQQRWFGPLHPLTYVVWGVLGVAVGTSFGIVSRQRRSRGIRIGKLIETAAYYDNPFEYWAYRNDQRWDRCGAQPVLKWGCFSWSGDPDN